jgi:outer membrane protein assembly factor BamB
MNTCFDRHGLSSLFIAALITVSGSNANSSDWPRFRGANGDGQSTDRDVPVEFGESKNLVWKVEIPGEGNSSPIVSQQRIFLQSAVEEGQKRLMLCLDLNTGSIVWDKPALGGVGKTHTKNTMASSSAAVDAERVYMPFWDGRNLSITAYDFGGMQLWTRDLGPFASQHGAGHSPVLTAGKVIVVDDQDGRSDVIALDAKTGEIAWKVSRPAHRACYSTPLLLAKAGAETELLVGSTFGVTAYDPASGDEKWKWAWETNDRRLRTVASPVLGDHMLFLSGGDGSGDRHAAAVDLGNGARPTPTLAWETRKLLPYVPCMLTRGEFLYFVNDFGIAGCCEAKTGRNVWTERLPGGDVTASPLMVEGRIYALNENGDAYVFAADPKFKMLATSKLDEGVRASPAVADGRLLVRTKHHLYCFGKTGVKQASK